jgi:OHCU decarboxylase
MDRLAEALGMDPVDVRIRNAMSEGSVMPTGQIVDSAAPVAELLHRVRRAPMPEQNAEITDLRELPGGVSNTTHGEGVVRGVGYAVSIKNVGFSEGFDDYSTARVRLQVVGGEPSVEVHTAAAEVGQGLVTVQAQIARTELGVEQVAVLPADTRVGSAGSSSASRQTYVTGGAVKAACEAVRASFLRLAAERLAVPAGDLRLDGGKVISATEGVLAAIADVLGSDTVEETVEWRHRPTQEIHPHTGQGNAHVQYAFAAHRAVVDVDVDLGLVKVVEIATAQDVGKAMNPQAVVGQIQGGVAQGLGLALMEEIQIVEGVVRNPSFTDYLIPTILDMPPTRVDVLECADPHAPYGLRGVGEPPTISSTPAIVAAIRAATGLPLHRVPVRPEHITGTDGDGVVTRLNALSEEDVRTELLRCCASESFATAVAARRPYGSMPSLLAAATDAVIRLEWGEIAVALRAHPRIGERATGAGREAAWSRQEQSGADDAAAETARALVDGNVAYEERFGHVFLICATGLSADEMLIALRGRLDNDVETERLVVRDELAKIAQLRLRKLAER